VAAAAREANPPVIPEAELTTGLLSLHAAFVTLTKGGELRGCIGRMDYARPLWRNLLDAARAAAVEDPRFPPVATDELPALRLEISVLESPRVLADVTQFDPQRQGIIVEHGWRSALLLPQVAREHGWDAAKTLETVCWKAGLPADAWREPDARLQVFEAFVFGEEAL
jgi:AmmeMemoRadiSam system protein A